MIIHRLTDGTPIAVIDDLGLAPRANDDIAREVVDAASRVRSAGSNNVNGWKSADTFLTWPCAAIAGLGAAIQRRIAAPDVLEVFGPLAQRPVARSVGQRAPVSWARDRALVAWAMLNHKGSYHKWHRHGRGYLVGVYYVTSGDPPAPTVFDAAGELGNARLDIAPVPGQLVVFPGPTWHTVLRYFGETPRITVAWELR